MKTPRAGEPTTREIAEAIERLRDLLFRSYGPDYSFLVVGRGAILGGSTAPGGIVEAVTRESEAK